MNPNDARALLQLARPETSIRGSEVIFVGFVLGVIVAAVLIGFMIGISVKP